MDMFMDIETFFNVASPFTLASLIADLDQAVDLDGPETNLLEFTKSTLVSNVGIVDAEELIAAAIDPRPNTKGNDR